MRRCGAILFVVLAACTQHAETTGASSIIAIDGSSTVFPIVEAVAEEFQKGNRAKVTIGVSGTGGGFKKFCQGEIALTGASRPVQPSEDDLCRRNGIEYIELPIAYDGIAVVVHGQNRWAEHMTLRELKELWSPSAQNQITRWNQIRTGWPDEEIHLFGAGVDSGTYDYFTEAIVGKEKSSRGDFTSSEDDNVLVQGISSDPLALGFFGYAYYVENADKLNLVAIDDGSGRDPVAPTPETIANGSYQPLSRPLFLYVAANAAERPEIRTFTMFLLESAHDLTREVGYVPLPHGAYRLVTARFEKRVTGSIFKGEGSKVGVTVEQLLAPSQP